MGEKQSQFEELLLTHLDGAYAKAITEESGPSFYNALGKLPAEFREILVLHEDEGWTYQQIAAALGITWEEVASKLSVARRRLRQELDDRRRTEE